MSYRTPAVEELVIHVCRFCGELRSICDRGRPSDELTGNRCAFLRELHDAGEEHADRLAVADDFTVSVRPHPPAIGARLVLGALALLLAVAPAEAKPPRCDLRGRIRLVDRGGDVKVKIVDALADMDVETVRSMPGPGQWQIVEELADHTVQIVDSGEDLRVRFVRSLPSCR